MKRILSAIVVGILFVNLFAITASADTTTVHTEDNQSNGMYYDKFYEQYVVSIYDGVRFYEELYYHYNNEGDTEWVLVHARTELCPTWVTESYAIFGNRIIINPNSINNFYVDYALYDVSENKFYDLALLWKYEKYSIYTDVINDVIDEQNIGEIIGDVDKDSELTVRDATYIQKCVAGLMEFPEFDIMPEDHAVEFYGPNLSYLSDYNRDGERNIKDVTAIQKRVAGMT